jgi:hypothetical protein
VRIIYALYAIEVEAETTGHVLWGCPAAKAIWSLCGRKIKKRSMELEDFVFTVQDIIIRVLDS